MGYQASVIGAARKIVGVHRVGEGRQPIRAPSLREEKLIIPRSVSTDKQFAPGSHPEACRGRRGRTKSLSQASVADGEGFQWCSEKLTVLLLLSHFLYFVTVIGCQSFYTKKHLKMSKTSGGNTASCLTIETSSG